ncbi:hypothetical protein B0H21DRAFT_822892 [Amylocystis lapponica]|nr:hypothetical protein B0H21DRAFT_822892 [Amylocystis lapponica]
MATDLFSIAGRVALVTGGGSGIGSTGLAGRGAGVGSIIPIVGDVSTIEGCKKIAARFEAAEEKAGASGAALDLLFNNAGMAAKEGFWGDGASPEGVRDALLQASDDDWAREFATNVGSVQWLSAAMLPYLVTASKTNDGFREGRGCIVVNTSVSAFAFTQYGQLYATSKAAAESMTHNLAAKFTKLGVRVNSIAPANVPSEMNDPKDPYSFIAQVGKYIPIGRLGNEEDVVGTVIYLSSRAGSFISGSMIKVDGGIVVSN